MQQSKFKDRCQIHPEYKIQYLRINNSDQSKSKSFFYCSQCVNLDPSFNTNDYQLIKEIILSGGDKILKKYPSITQEIMDRLIQIVNNNQGNEDILEQVNNFFNDFKKQINHSLDNLHKKMIQIAQQIPQNEDYAKQQYKEISRLNELKELLLKNHINLDQKEIECQELIKSTQLQPNTLLISSILNNQYYFDPSPALLIQKSILQTIEAIELFKKDQNKYKLNVKLCATNFLDCQNHQTIINKNNESQVIINNFTFGWQNTVSDIILKPDNKYIFRLKIDNIEKNNSIVLGLMQKDNINIKQGCDDKLCCNLKNIGSSIILEKLNYGIEKQQQQPNQNQSEDQFKIKLGGCIEMRICQRDKILQIYDYPEYKQKVELDDQYIQKLNNAKELKLYIGLCKVNESVTLVESMTVLTYQ